MRSPCCSVLTSACAHGRPPVLPLDRTASRRLAAPPSVHRAATAWASCSAGCGGPTSSHLVPLVELVSFYKRAPADSVAPRSTTIYLTNQLQQPGTAGHPGDRVGRRGGPGGRRAGQRCARCDGRCGGEPGGGGGCVAPRELPSLSCRSAAVTAACLAAWQQSPQRALAWDLGGPACLAAWQRSPPRASACAAGSPGPAGRGIYGAVCLFDQRRLLRTSWER